VSRNQFENNHNPDEEPETYTVPLKMETGGPVIGEARINAATGQLIDITVTDEEMKENLKPRGFSFAPNDPHKGMLNYPAREE